MRSPRADTYGNLSIALTGSKTSARAIGQIADKLHTQGIDGMLTKASGEVEWNDDNEQRLSTGIEPRVSRDASSKGLACPMVPSGR